MKSSALHLALVVDVTARGGTVMPLVREGLEYSQIAELLSEAKDTGLLELNRDELILTDRGRDFLAAHRRFMKRGNRGKWLHASEHERVAQLPEDAVYLPDAWSWRRNIHPRVREDRL